MASAFDLNPYAAAGTGILGLFEFLQSQKQLNQLNAQPAPQFTPTPELMASKGRADQLSNFGFAPAEKAGFRTNVAQDINTTTRKALDLGGGSLSKVIGGIGKINEMGAESKFATSDAALHRQNIKYADKFAEQYQELADKNIAEQEKERLLAEERLGGAEQAGLSQLGTFGNYLGTALGGGKGTGAPAGVSATDWQAFMKWKASQPQ